MQLLAEIEDHIKKISGGLFASFQPRLPGVTQNPFFIPNKPSLQIPSTESRSVLVPLPKVLMDLYSAYPPDVEFYDGVQWTLLSETEICERWNHFRDAGQLRMIDIAVAYRGMGHVTVLCYDPVSEGVFEIGEGGSNDWDRQDNLQRRILFDVSTQPTDEFQGWMLKRNASLHCY